MDKIHIYIFLIFMIAFTTFPFLKKAHSEIQENKSHKEQHKKKFKEKHSHHKNNKHKKKEDIIDYIFRLTEKLNLTNDQSKEISIIAYNLKREHFKLKANIKITNVDLQELFNLENFHENELLNITYDISDMIGSFYKLKSKALIDILILLTDKQRAELKKINKNLLDFSYIFPMTTFFNLQIVYPENK